MRQRTRSALIEIVFLLLLVFPAGARAAAEFQLSTLTYNVWGLPWPASHATWRYAEIGPRIKNFDVVALQEMWSNDTDVAWQLSDHPYHVFGGQAHGLAGGSGLIVASKYPIVESHFEKYVDCADSECAAGKGVLMFRVRHPSGVEIDFYQTHLNAWEANDLVRTGQILQLVGVVNELSNGRPIVVLGDFNAELRSINYDELVGNLTLNDAYEDHLRSVPDPTPQQRTGFTFDIDRNPWAAPAISGENHPQRIDHTFYRDTGEVRLSVDDAALAMTEVGTGGAPLSDHFGMTTLFKIRAK